MPGTAAIHVGHILDKLGCQTRAQVAAWAAGVRPLAMPPSCRRWTAVASSVQREGVRVAPDSG